MKSALIILSFLLVSCVRGEELKEYNISDVEWTPAYAYLKGTDQRLTGIVRNYYPDGTLKAYVELKEGVSHGREIHYYKNGQKRHEVVFENHEPVGEWRFWFPDGRLMNLEDQKKLPEIDKEHS